MRIQILKRIVSAESALNVLLLFVPISIALEFTDQAGGTAVFVTSAIAIIPLAGWIGRATEHLAEHVGAGLGGLINATFGNAAELIIAAVALREGLYDLVKASITGSIIGNTLLVFGLSALLGGIKFRSQRYNPTAGALGSTMLLLSGIALVVPAVFHMLAGENAEPGEQTMSLFIAIILMITYLLSLVFSLKTHSHLYTGGAAQEEPETAGRETWSRKRSIVVLLVAAALVAVMSELLVGSVEHAAATIGMNEVFIGVILVALIGNAAEHSAAILVALRNKMDLCVNIAIGSSLQIALFVAPFLVFLSYAVGPQPMDLVFTEMEVLAVVASVWIMQSIAQDGETHWMEGVQLLAVYAILALAFFFL
jgi:Ca2+:H+ antiporter